MENQQILPHSECNGQGVEVADLIPDPVTDIAPAAMAPKVYRFKVAPVEPSRWGDTGPSPVQILQDMQDLPAIERARDPYLKIKADLVEWEPPKIKPRSKRGQRTRRWR